MERANLGRNPSQRGELSALDGNGSGNIVSGASHDHAEPQTTNSLDSGLLAAEDHQQYNVPTHAVTDDAPVFWTRQGRTVSNASYRSIDQHRPPPISLEDHSEENHELSQSCWARSATIDEFVVVSGATGIGAYVVWHCTVKTLKGGDIGIRKRYSEFDQLRTDLVRAFPHAEAMIPQLPRKSIVSRFRPWFLEQRQAGLSHFLNCVLLNPEFAASPMLKDFIFA